MRGFGVAGFVEVDVPYKVGPLLRKGVVLVASQMGTRSEVEWTECRCKPARCTGDLLGSGGLSALVPWHDLPPHCVGASDLVEPFDHLQSIAKLPTVESALIGPQIQVFRASGQDPSWLVNFMELLCNLTARKKNDLYRLALKCFHLVVGIHLSVLRFPGVA